MGEFDLTRFADALTTYLRVYFPYMVDEELDKSKHPKRNPLHLREAVFNKINMVHTLDTITFEIGNGSLELTHPYYHILEDSEVIHIKNKSTVASRGSQDRISDVRARDYGIVKWNGKTYSQEYKKNIRGSRSKSKKARTKMFVVSSDGTVTNVKINDSAKYYLNTNFKYIERAIDQAIPLLCESFNLKSKPTRNTGLEEEWLTQESVASGTDLASGLIDALNSFGEE